MIDSYVSTGVCDTALEAMLDDGSVHNLGNGQQNYGYAVKGVKFSNLKIADICTYSETEADGTHKDMVLYKFADGQLMIYGLEDNTYVITEIQTDNGYTLLRDGITVTITPLRMKIVPAASMALTFSALSRTTSATRPLRATVSWRMCC